MAEFSSGILSTQRPEVNIFDRVPTHAQMLRHILHGEAMATHYPRSADDTNELPDGLIEI